MLFFLWYLLIGLVAGWIANMIVRGSGAGLWINLLVGIVGGFLGGWLFSLFGIFAVRNRATLDSRSHSSLESQLEPHQTTF